MQKEVKFSVRVDSAEEFIQVMRWVKANCKLQMTEAQITGKWYHYIHYTPSFYSLSTSQPERFILFGDFMRMYKDIRPMEQASYYIARLANMIAKAKVPMSVLERECGFTRGTIRNLVNGKHDPRFATVVTAIEGLNKIRNTNYSLADLI